MMHYYYWMESDGLPVDLLMWCVGTGFRRWAGRGVRILGCSFSSLRLFMPQWTDSNAVFMRSAYCAGGEGEDQEIRIHRAETFRLLNTRGLYKTKMHSLLSKLYPLPLSRIRQLSVRLDPSTPKCS